MQVIWVIYKIPDKKYNWNQRKEEDFFIDSFFTRKKSQEWKEMYGVVLI